jgi:polyphosphate kinase
MTAKKKATPSRFINGPYINREHSWLLFNRRVLEQASDPANPLLERCKFLSIFSSNLDEFFMIRVGSLVTQMHHAPKLKENKTGLTAEQQLAGILCEVQNLYAQGKRTFASLRTQLYAHGVAITKGSELTAHQKNLCRSAFLLRFLPLLSPMVLDAKHPMIRFENLETYLVVHLHKVNRSMIGILGISPKLDRLFEIPGGKKTHVITSEELVATFADLAFPGYALKDKALVRVTRNADFDTRLQDGDLETDFDFTKYIQDKVEERSIMNVVRLEMDGDNETIRSFLLKNLNLSDKFCYRIKHAFDYSFMTKLDPFFPIEQLPALHYPPFKGAVPADLKEVPGMIERVRQGDVFLSYPFESMDPLVQLLNECADDPRTVSIKMTIYRIDSHSRIVEALKRASENKKEVTVLIELFARFDEENNLYYANMLREAGCTIFYGTANYKVHAKIISIIRTDGEEISYITHLGTGNYNEDTSRQYTDLNLITSDRRIGEDAVAFFRNLAIMNYHFPYQAMLIAPFTLKQGIIAAIDGEISKAKAGIPARIIAKMNSLTDKEIIDKLIQASCEGVPISLIVRGICCLRPGLNGLTDHISVISIVGRFLEHSRIYCFGNGEQRKIFISSADLMTRNTDKRIEIATPIFDPRIVKRISGILEVLLSDTIKAKKLTSKGTYKPIQAKGKPMDSQAFFLRHPEGTVS